MVVPENIKAIVFDFDGTLFHLDIDWQKLKQELGIDPSEKTIGEILQEYIEIEHPNLQKVTEIEVAAIGDNRLDHATASLLSRLTKQYKLAIFTRNSRQAVEKVLQGTGLENRLLVVGREDVENLKPHPEGLGQIATTLGCLISEILLVGDTYHDIEAAHRVGVVCVIVANPKLEYTPKGADKYIGSLLDLNPR